MDLELKHLDCVKGMKKMPEASVDVVVTSPPYNLGIKYGKYKDNQAREDYLKWSEKWVLAIKRVLKEDGSFFLNVGATPSNPLLPHEMAILFSKHLVFQNTFHWVKSISVKPKNGEQVSAGHFKPINSKRYVTDCHEFVFHFTHNGNVKLDRLAVGVPYADKSNISRWGHTGGKDKRCRGNTWFIPYITINSRVKERPHPATFPVELAENCINIHGKEDETVVLDPFVGIGHSAVAAKRCDVKKFIGFDIEKEYLVTAKENVESDGEDPQQEIFSKEEIKSKKSK